MTYTVKLTPGMHELVTYCRSEYEKAESVIHTWGHITRTTTGAVWFCTVLGGTERDTQLAYTAGILHDIVRPITEKECHARASAEKARKILDDYPEFTNPEKYRIYQAIKDHRRPVTWEGPLHQSVYLSDKIFEHMGAYIDFRAPVWAGELSHTDFEGLEPVEAVLSYYKKASQKFLTGIFPDTVRNVVDYQRSWNKKYVKALQNNKDWAVDMAEHLFFSGREKKDFEQTLVSFNPKGTLQKKWAHEMRAYIAGEKFKYFQTLL